MKDQHHHIDDLFKRLQEDSFEVPVSFMDDLTTRLDQEFPVQVKKRGTIFIFLNILSLLVMTSAMLYTHYSPKNNDSKTSSLSKEFRQSTAESENKLKSDLSSKKKSPSGDVGSTLQESKFEDPIKKKEQVGNLKHSENINESNNYASDKSHEIKFQGVYSNKVEANPMIINQNHSQGEQFNKNTNNEQTNGKLANSPDIKLNPAKHEGDEQIENFTYDTINHSDFILNPRQPYIIDILAKNEPIFNSINDRTSIVREAKRPWEIDLQLYAGLSYTSMKLKMNSENTNFSPLNNQTAFSPTIGIRSNLFYRNINTSLGLEYYQSIEKFNLSTKNLVQTGTDSVYLGMQIDSIYVDSMYVYDSTEVYQYQPIFDSIQQDLPIKNNYSWLSIPIAFGYRFSMKNWDIIPRVGVNLNVGISKNRGDYPASNHSLQKIDAVRFNMDYMIQTEVRRNFNTFHVFVSPYFKGSLNPIVKSSDFNISHQNWGVNVGAGIKF